MASTPNHSPQFTGSAVQATFDGLLFDMDGTIIDSTDAVEKYWHTVGKEIGVNPQVILQTAHGRRSIDTLKVLAPDKATWEYVAHMEGLIPEHHGADAHEIPGARALLTAVIAAAVPWAIVTSGSVPLVSGWLRVLDLPPPAHLVTAESVANGKPDPACYVLGRERLGLGLDTRRHGRPSAVLVLEDSPAGIRAGKAAGCSVLGLVTSHSADQVAAAGPDWIVQDLSSVRVVEVKEQAGGKKVTLEFRDLLASNPP